MWLIMINPFRLLAQRARAINAQSKPEEVAVGGVQEAVEIAEAVEGMLARIGDEQQRTRAALEAARDFAAVASHELRTPLTAMRTNLEVLSTLQMRDEQRQEVIADVMRTQSRIEATLTALERLAQGDLTTADDFVPVDVTELLDRAAHDAMRNYPGLKVTLASSTTVLMIGLPAGLRLVIDNAITNAVKHGGATEIQLSADSSGAGVTIAVDDNGTGVPEEERRTVFERFSRGSTAARSGSGLGLALVAQQADLHRGTAGMEASHLGGARLVLRLPPPS
jgi:two-component system sensor histidine kinase PrrB